ncbi:MAG TPA: acyltransferase family protein, partial [Anaerovoracaceae bacterium]|nr:acyltransferase family protein [Anaerovoracaceae bacterium]
AFCKALKPNTWYGEREETATVGKIRSQIQVESEDDMNCSKKTDQSILHQGGLRADSSGYMPGLDGLRALAVFAVIAYHLELAWAPGGLLGVSLFFVLSGYLITNILLMQWERSGSIDLKDFWLRRARRLLPALFTMLAGVTFWVAFYAPERLAALKQEALAAVFYSSNWYLIFHQVSYFERFGPLSPLGHLWSLAVEEQFYLFWPILLGLGLRCLPRRKWVIRGTVAVTLASVAVMALIYIPGHDPSRVYYGTDTRAFALLVGAVLAMVWPGGQMTANLSGKKRLALDTAGSMGLLVVLLMIGKTNQYQTFLYQGGLLLFSLAAACVVAALAHPVSFLGRIFSWRPLRWLGECSYGIYLWHYPVIVLTSPAVNTEGPELSRALWQIAASIILAALSRYLIEEPIRYGWRKRFQRRTPDLQQTPDLPRRRPLALSAKLSVSILLVFVILFATAYEGPQISAKDFTESHTAGKQAQAIGAQSPEEQALAIETQAPENQTQAPGEQTQVSEEQTQASEEQVQTPEEQVQVPDDQAQAPEKQVQEDGKNVCAAGKEDLETQENKITGEGITAIGDSLMIDVAPVLEERLPGIVVDGQIGRQMHQAADVIDRLRKDGKLGETVILALGTNGSFTEKQLTDTLDSLKGAGKIVLVNTRVPKPWETVVNETLAQVLESYPNVKLIDWFSASSGHNDYFYPDGVHLNRTGAEAYGKIMVEALTSDQNEAQ